jgi:hypothetical protein
VISKQFRVRIRDRTMYCLHLEEQRATSTRGVIVTCNMLQDAVYRVDRRKPDCKRSGAGVCLFCFLFFSILPHRYPETAYLYDFSVQSSKSDLFFSFPFLVYFVRSEDTIGSTAHTHAHVLLHIRSYIHSFISLYIVLASPTLTFFGQEDQTGLLHFSATMSAIE